MIWNQRYKEKYKELLDFCRTTFSLLNIVRSEMFSILLFSNTSTIWPVTAMCLWRQIRYHKTELIIKCDKHSISLQLFEHLFLSKWKFNSVQCILCKKENKCLGKFCIWPLYGLQSGWIWLKNISIKEEKKKEFK